MDFQIKYLMLILLFLLQPQIGHTTKCVDVNSRHYIKNNDAFIVAKVIDVNLEKGRAYYKVQKVRNLKGEVKNKTFDFSTEVLMGANKFSPLVKSKEYIIALNKKEGQLVPKHQAICDPSLRLNIFDFFGYSDELEIVTKPAAAITIAKLYADEFLPSNNTENLNYSAKLENDNWTVTAETRCPKFVALFKECRIYNSKIIINKYGKITSFIHKRIFN